VITVEVPVPGRTYAAIVGRGAKAELPALLPGGTGRVAVVTQRGIGFPVDPGVEHRVFTIEAGEDAKTMRTVEWLCRQWATWGLTRADCVVAVGGGMTTDVVGFAAASYHRGVPVVHVATTLLGMVDAAIGGKTGVNLPEGKNLVGAFWQPSGVVCDLDALDSLPPRELRGGYGELAKYRFLPGGEDLADLPLDEQVAQCIRIKAAIVAADEREGGVRATLNYGHTLAHALETAGGYDLRHGEAVAVGLLYAAALARRLGRIDDERVAEHHRIVSRYELPEQIPDGLDDDALLSLMARDKKALTGLTFALDGPDGVEVVTDVDADVARAALADVR
jgi:5-deoxy-5-amino-3-dehydroquinate synthase